MSLIDKLKKSRETSVVVEGKTFHVRRPTDLEMVELHQSGQVTQGDVIKRYVLGWDGVLEIDIIPGGTGIPVPFEAELFGEWISDHPEYWKELTDAILNLYAAHQKTVEDSIKKPVAG